MTCGGELTCGDELTCGGPVGGTESGGDSSWLVAGFGGVAGPDDVRGPEWVGAGNRTRAGGFVSAGAEGVDACVGPVVASTVATTLDAAS